MKVDNHLLQPDKAHTQQQNIQPANDRKAWNLMKISVKLLSVVSPVSTRIKCDGSAPQWFYRKFSILLVYWRYLYVDKFYESKLLMSYGIKDQNATGLDTEPSSTK